VNPDARLRINAVVTTNWWPEAMCRNTPRGQSADTCAAMEGRASWLTLPTSLANRPRAEFEADKSHREWPLALG